MDLNPAAFKGVNGFDELFARMINRDPFQINMLIAMHRYFGPIVLKRPDNFGITAYDEAWSWKCWPAILAGQHIQARFDPLDGSGG